jgi:UDP-N-acetylglucosamine 2-epimerase (non-hydrolysing)
VPVAHVEAGLRTYNLERPFPEEALRQMIGRLTRCTSRRRRARANALLGESIPAKGTSSSPATPWSTRSSGSAITRASTAESTAAAILLVDRARRENWGSDVDEICLMRSPDAAAHRDLEVRSRCI